MEIKRLLNDDDAVSPVIGVILMVAITVILAAVIASFVLGLGNQAQQQTPTASFTFEYESGAAVSADGNVTITHDGGDSINDNELYVRGNFGSQADVASANSWEAYNTGDLSVAEKTTSGQDSQVVSGDRLVLMVDSDYEISVNYEAQEGQASATLSDDEGPDA